MDDISPILVVDDEMLVRLALTEALEEGGYSVIEAADGDAALEQIEQADMLRGLVTDIRMPGPSGWEIAHRAREKVPALAVVYVTGDSTDQWASNGVPLSCVLQKPFAHAELVAALSNSLVAHPPHPPQG